MNYTNENTEKKSRSSDHSHHHHHHHHHSSSKHYYKKKEYDSSSAMERRGQNIIYDNVRKERIMQMIKRSIFVFIVIIFIVLIAYFMSNPSKTYSDIKLFNKTGITQEEVNELKNKITKYEFYIEEIENRLSKYEEVESILK